MSLLNNRVLVKKIEEKSVIKMREKYTWRGCLLFCVKRIKKNISHGHVETY
jgi:hypothetical protein